MDDYHSDYYADIPLGFSPMTVAKRSGLYDRPEDNSVKPEPTAEESVIDALVKRLSFAEWKEYFPDDEEYLYLLGPNYLDSKMITVTRSHMQEAVTRGKVIVHAKLDNSSGSPVVKRSYSVIP